MHDAMQRRRSYAFHIIVVVLCLFGKSSQDTTTDDDDIEPVSYYWEAPPLIEEEEITHIDYGNHNQEWEDGPSSWEEFGHDNDPNVCGLPLLTVEEWEAGRHWLGDKPVLVSGVTDGWAALSNWKKREMLQRYPNAEATMGEAKLLGETGPDGAGKNLSPTTVKDFITKHMYDPTKYFFDRKIAIPKGMLEDCYPFPMPTRAYLDDPELGSIYAPSKKRRVRTKPDRELWRDHLAISIGSDLQGLTFHHHREAWNIVIFGKKRWILWDHARWKDNTTIQWRTTRDYVRHTHVTGAEWIRRLYPEPEREYEIRNFGHDCIQHAGQMMFIPHRWMHMVSCHSSSSWESFSSSSLFDPTHFCSCTNLHHPGCEYWRYGVGYI